MTDPLAEIRARHTQTEYGLCDACTRAAHQWVRWPCDAAVALAAADERYDEARTYQALYERVVDERESAESEAARLQDLARSALVERDAARAESAARLQLIADVHWRATQAEAEIERLTHQPAEEPTG